MRQLSWHDLSWALHRTPPKVLGLIKDNPNSVFVAGGFIRSCITGEKVSDIDLFTPSKEKAMDCAMQLKGMGKVNESDNAYSLFSTFSVPVQFIHRWSFSKADDCIDSFDFTIACAAFWWDGAEWKSVCDDDFYSDLAAKRLVYRKPVRNEDAGGSLLRVLKFYQRGYRIPLDSLGAVVARLMTGVEIAACEQSAGRLGTSVESQVAKVVTGRLREVDPNTPEESPSYLPAPTEEETER